MGEEHVIFVSPILITASGSTACAYDMSFSWLAAST